MTERIVEGSMAFLVDGAEGIGSVRVVGKDTLTIYVENAGDFIIPRTAVAAVHAQKVMLRTGSLDREFLKAIGHAHDREDPKLAG